MGAGSSAGQARRLEVVRDSAHAWSGAGAQAMTHGELFERLAQWGALTSEVGPRGTSAGAGNEPGLRDDEAARWAAATVLAARGALGPRLASQLAALRRELVHARVPAHEIAARLPEDATGRLDELARLFRDLAHVDARLAAAGLVDRADALARAVARLERGERPRFLHTLAGVDVRDLVEATDLELDALIALARGGFPVRVVLPVDDAGLTAGLEPVLARLEAAHDVLALDVVHGDLAATGGEGDASGTAPAALVRALFTDRTAPGAAVETVRCDDPADEARKIASRVARIRADDPDARIAVTVRAWDDAGERSLGAVADALAGHRVSVRVRARPLANSPGGRALLDVIALARDGVPRDRLLAFLVSPARRGTLALEEGARVFRVLRRAAARSDVEDARMTRGSYAHRLARLEAGLDARDAISHGDVQAAARIVADALRVTRALPDTDALGAYLDALVRIARDELEDSPGMYVADVVDALEEARASCKRAGNAGARTGIDALYVLVQDVLADKRMPDLVDDDRAVELLDVPSLWGRRFDHVFVLGVEEGRFPVGPVRRGLLSDADRARINGLLGKRALRTEDAPDERAPARSLEALWLAGCLLAAERTATFSVAQRDVRGREGSASGFFAELARARGAPVVPAAVLGAPSLRDHVARVARARARGTLDDARANALGIEGALLADIDRFRTMQKERARFFGVRAARGTAEGWARAPYAFQIDPARIHGTFAKSFGLTPERPLTPTRLEALAECRMHGFVQHVLGVDVDRAPGNAADARVLGTLAHAVLEKFFDERKAQRVPVTMFTPADRARLHALVALEAAPLLAGVATGHLSAISAQIEWLETALVRAVSILSRDPKVTNVEPRDLEIRIGVSATAPGGEKIAPPYAAVPMVLGASSTTLYLGGVIDRVDEGPGGRVVIDYKTSGTSSIRRKAHKDALFDKHFQLLLYLRLLEHHRPSERALPLHGYLVSVRDGTTSDDVHEVDDLRARVTDDARADGLAAGVARVVLPILEGTLPPDAGDRCEQCRLQRVCRVPLVAEMAPDIDDNEEGAPS